MAASQDGDFSVISEAVPAASADTAGELYLAPMEGLADALLRDILTRFGGYDACVTEFARVSGTLLPHRFFRRLCPELAQGSRTACGTPVSVQLLGSDPVCMAENAAHLAELGPWAIDLNFGCPAPTVNRHRGGAVLLAEPELVHRIASEVRRAVPAHIPVTAKMRLGLDDPAQATDCARALSEGGVSRLVVHARTRADMYRPPARWEWIGPVREAVNLPVVANGEVWDRRQWARCREVSGVLDVMLGRGAVADPLLARRIRGEVGQGEGWPLVLSALEEFWLRVLEALEPRHAPGRLKMWLGFLVRGYPQAGHLLSQLRAEKNVGAISSTLAAQRLLMRQRADGVHPSEQAGALVG